jgi:hypothetical protein
VEHAVAPPPPGPHNPLPSTPEQVPRSVRRTWSIDITFPDGRGESIVAELRGRDLRRRADRATDVVDEFAVGFDIDALTNAIVAVDDRRSPVALEGLVGAGVRSGFGRILAERFPDESGRRSLWYSALEDLGGAALVSGYARLRGGTIEFTREHAELAASTQADICIGWAAEGPIIEMIREHGRNPVPIGPIVPAFDGDEVRAWHDMPAMQPSTVRRRRRIDVAAPVATDGSFRMQEHFRDSYAGDEGEMSLHEYLVDAIVRDGRLVSIDVDPRVLPWDACPGAAASAQQLVGVALDEIPARIRAALTGVTTCTHLNSSLRVLADARSLAPLRHD